MGGWGYPCQLRLPAADCNSPSNAIGQGRVLGLSKPEIQEFPTSSEHAEERSRTALGMPRTTAPLTAATLVSRVQVSLSSSVGVSGSPSHVAVAGGIRGGPGFLLGILAPHSTLHNFLIIRIYLRDKKKSKINQRESTLMISLVTERKASVTTRN